MCRKELENYVYVYTNTWLPWLLHIFILQVPSQTFIW